MEYSDFEHFFMMQGPSVYVLKGSVSHKAMPPGWVVEDKIKTEDLPHDFLMEIHEVASASNFKVMKDSIFDLPMDDIESTIRTTRDGLILLKTDNHWLQIGSA